jgi:thiol-disulfide isomerase/thioredoxin
VLNPEQATRWREAVGQRMDTSKFERLHPTAPEFPEGGRWLDGRTARMAALRGKVVLVHFYAFQCHNCQANFRTYNRWRASLREKGVEIIGIQTPETEAEREAFQKLVDQAYLVNDVLIGGTLVLLAVVFLGIYGYAANVRSIRDRAEAVMARVPSLGVALLNTAISTSFTVAASMMKGGVGFLPSASTAAIGADHLEVRDFWATAVNRVETGETIPRSLSSPLLNSSEAMLIASHTTQRELGEVLERIAERRDGIALAASKSFALWMFVASMVYSGIAVMFTLYVVYVQNKQMMSRVQG